MKKVYLAGQSNVYENNWKDEFKVIKGFDFYDPEIDSDQSSPDTFFPQDLQAVNNADILVANPGLATSEATWIEVGFFLKKSTVKPGETCKSLIIIWKESREPKWSIKFVEKAGCLVSSLGEAKQKLLELK